MTDGVTVTTFCLPHMVHKGGHGSSVPNHVKPKLPGKLKKWRQFSYHIKAKPHKNKLHKMRPACTENQVKGYFS